MRQEECPCLTWQYIEGKNGEKEYSKTKIYTPFLQKCLMIFEDAIRRLEKTYTTNKWLIFVNMTTLYLMVGKVTVKGQPA